MAVTRTDSQVKADYAVAYKSESWGEFSYGIRIEIASPQGVTDSVKRASYESARLLEQAITRDFYAASKDAQASAKAEKAHLLTLFSCPIYVEAIPNGYCHQACCEHRPWFVVTTKIGRIKIGWRKSVIAIDWTETLAPDTETLFPSENVTKDKKMIHAWGYEKAEEYINALHAPSASAASTS